METDTISRNGKKRRAMAIFGAIVLVGLAAGYVSHRYRLTHVTTDDAYVQGTVHMIAARVAGTVKSVTVEDNQPVEEGDVLVEIDPEVFGHRLAEAEAGAGAEGKRLGELAATKTAQETKVSAAIANLAKAMSGREELDARIKAGEAELAAMEALAEQAHSDMTRAERLFEKEVVTRDRYEKARTQHQTAVAARDAARELLNQAAVARSAHENTVAQARAALAVERALLAQVEASIESQGQQLKKRDARAEIERLMLSYTTVTSPGAGFVTRKSVEVGNQVQAGQPLMSVVSLGGAYVLANYKETQLRLIKPGQPVALRLDAFPGVELRGRVESIMAGTGSAFALFPPENASGNFVKVVQRVPVRIAFDDAAAAAPYLRIGMSVEPTILTAE
jgi:membrane fusion protein (multidrug efflux system)